jgi:myosin protein heavy chain
MAQLNSTHPHFVRCILPNHEKRPKKFDTLLVLDQLRCNGVLEGIRIARTGYPNRLFFTEFRQRYEVLMKNMPKGYVDGQKACTLILKELGLDENLYKVGLTKVFFKSGVLAVLEERRESMIRQLIGQLQSIIRGSLQRSKIRKELFRVQATQTIKKNFGIYLQLKSNPWWKLYVRMRPLLIASRANDQKVARDSEIKKLEQSLKNYENGKQKLEQEHRKAELELERINKILEGERLLALDKEEILKRAQARETDLEDQLNVTLQDLDRLETQCEELLTAKRKADSQAELWRKELERGTTLIASLESEKQQLKEQIATLESEVDKVTEHQADKNNETQKLTQELSFLKESLGQRERKAEELEMRLKKSEAELENKMKSIVS